VIPVGSAPGGGFVFRDVVRLERQSSVVLLYRLPDPKYPKDMALLAVVPTAGVANQGRSNTPEGRAVSVISTCPT
jgi:hypothetical protein